MSMTLASTSSLPPDEKFRSKLDPNVAPFAPSKSDNKGIRQTLSFFAYMYVNITTISFYEIPIITRDPD